MFPTATPTPEPTLVHTTPTTNLGPSVSPRVYQAVGTLLDPRLRMSVVHRAGASLNKLYTGPTDEVFTGLKRRDEGAWIYRPREDGQGANT